MATISFRIDDNLKQEAEGVLDALGLNMSTAMIMFTKAIVREHGIPLNLTVDPFYSRSNQERLSKTISAYERGLTTGVTATMVELEAAEDA